jgi:hypothetical protein
MCVHLGQPGKDINADIKTMVQAGEMPAEVQEAADALRVIANNAVHPGEIDLRDDAETATGLFSLLNFIVDQRISQPKKRKALFNMLPEGARQAIENRDAA